MGAKDRMILITYVGEDHDYLYIWPQGTARGPHAYPEEIDARRYLDFASQDLIDGMDRGTINAFGNVKRALHIIVDDTLHAYGLFALNRKTLIFLRSWLSWMPPDCFRSQSCVD